MPTLTNSQEPDSYNIDYYYSKYKDRHGVGLQENKPQALRVLPAGAKPDFCDGKKPNIILKFLSNLQLQLVFAANFIQVLLLNTIKLVIQLQLANPKLQPILLFLNKALKKQKNYLLHQFLNQSTKLKSLHYHHPPLQHVFFFQTFKQIQYQLL